VSLKFGRGDKKKNSCRHVAKGKKNLLYASTKQTKERRRKNLYQARETVSELTERVGQQKKGGNSFQGLNEFGKKKIRGSN